jgi:hypothetical protein
LQKLIEADALVRPASQAFRRKDVTDEHSVCDYLRGLCETFALFAVKGFPLVMNIPQ